MNGGYVKNVQWKCVAAVLAAVFVSYLTDHITRKVFVPETNARTQALSDVVHDSWIGYTCDLSGQNSICPQFARKFVRALPDKLLIVNIIVGLYLSLRVGLLKNNVRYTLEILSDATLIYSFIGLLRCTTISVTSLPTPNPLCRDRTEFPNEGWIFVPTGCNDLVFSGHTTAACLTLFLVMCTNDISTFGKAIWFLFFCSCALASTATRDHYTLDVLVSIYISLPIMLLRRAHFQELLHIKEKSA